MTIKDWIQEQQKQGKYTFSVDELRHVFNRILPHSLIIALQRLSKKGVIMSPFKGFYSAVLPHYQLRGIVPPVFYIDQLMEWLDRQYYICMLSAAEMYGAAHQRPQRLQVFAKGPAISLSDKKNPHLMMLFRKNIPQALVWKKNSEVDTICYSSPELTAADLVQYQQHCGGLSNVSTVLSELVEKTDFSREFEALYATASTATLQRLGYLLDEILEEHEQAQTLFDNLKRAGADIRRVRLNPSADTGGCPLNRRWKVIANQEIELDDI